MKPKLADARPDLVAEWDADTNGDLDPARLSSGSGKDAWWVCSSDSAHRWRARIAARAIHGTGCPQCSGRVAVSGASDLLTKNPDLAAEWDYEANGDLSPADVKPVSGLTVWWVCRNDSTHRWSAKISNRHNGTGCPQCAGNAVSDRNRLSVKRPELAAEFVALRDDDARGAEHVSVSSAAIARWRCAQGHFWESQVYSRTNGGSGCPICSNRTVSAGANDLATTHPEIASQWLDSPIDGAKPTTVTYGSDTIATWQCGKVQAHTWSATVSSRAVAGAGCPRCSNNVSRAEEELADVIRRLLPDESVETSKRGIVTGELDIVIAAKGVAVEFDGLYWHSEQQGRGRTYHKEKSEQAARAGLQLIHVWEDDWRLRRDIVVRAIAHKLGATSRLLQSDALITAPGVDPTRKVGARSLSARVVDAATARGFLANNHIQGFGSGTCHLALSDDNDVLALLSVRRIGNDGHEGEWSIDRYATACIVQGGFTRLLARAQEHIIEEGLPLSKWVTFADGGISDSGLYERHGFVRDGEVPPDYRYVIRDERVHKFNYRINRFRKDPNLAFVEGLSENELAALNRLPRVWDCGKTRWTKSV